YRSRRNLLDPPLIPVTAIHAPQDVVERRVIRAPRGVGADADNVAAGPPLPRQPPALVIERIQIVGFPSDEEAITCDRRLIEHSFELLLPRGRTVHEIQRDDPAVGERKEDGQAVLYGRVGARPAELASP